MPQNILTVTLSNMTTVQELKDNCARAQGQLARASEFDLNISLSENLHRRLMITENNEPIGISRTGSQFRNTHHQH